MYTCSINHVIISTFLLPDSLLMCLTSHIFAYFILIPYGFLLVTRQGLIYKYALKTVIPLKKTVVCLYIFVLMFVGNDVRNGLAHIF